MHASAKSLLRPTDLAVLITIVAHALAQIGGSILIWRGAVTIPETIVRTVVAIEITLPRLVTTFQVYTFNFYVWLAFCGVMACLVQASRKKRALALSFSRAELAAFLALLAIMIAPAIILYFNLFPTAYTRRGNNVLTSDSLFYVFKYAGEFSLSACLSALPWVTGRTRAVEGESIARWSRAKTAYDDARSARRDA